MREITPVAPGAIHRRPQRRPSGPLHQGRIQAPATDVQASGNKDILSAPEEPIEHQLFFHGVRNDDSPHNKELPISKAIPREPLKPLEPMIEEEEIVDDVITEEQGPEETLVDLEPERIQENSEIEAEDDHEVPPDPGVPEPLILPSKNPVPPTLEPTRRSTRQRTLTKDPLYDYTVASIYQTSTDGCPEWVLCLLADDS